MTSSPRGEPPICYVSSEHCYQKPGASWVKDEEKDEERPTAAVKLEADAEEKVETLHTDRKCLSHVRWSLRKFCS